MLREDFRLAFVTGRALFGIELIGSDLKHVIALDAHTVQEAADNRAGLTHGFHSRLMLVDGAARGKLRRHAQIVACWNVPTKARATASLKCLRASFYSRGRSQDPEGHTPRG
jgi:hypothetical protein